MRADLLAKAAELASRRVPFVFAVVVRRKAATSSQPGDAAIVTADGEFHGWLGGSCTRPSVVREAQAALRDGKPRLFVLTPDPETERRPDVVVAPMTCHSGGTVEIYIEPVLPALRLVVYGDSPIAAALRRLGEAMGYAIPETDAVAADGHPSMAVVATMGEDDEAAIARALALEPDYLGVVASARRFTDIRSTLLAQGHSSAKVDAIRCPAGLRLGAETPEEIALSILAEIVERRRHAKARPDAPAAIGRAAALAQAATAIDPVCHMTVEIASARHVAEYDGMRYFFCGAGCKTRFLAEPHRFLVAGRRA
jgi:xanthine dehydrogenase accessory factor